jgi:hypothetical protein
LLLILTFVLILMFAGCQKMGTQQQSILQCFGFADAMPRKKGKDAEDADPAPATAAVLSTGGATAGAVRPVGEGMAAQGQSASWEKVKLNIVRIIALFFGWIRGLDVDEPDNATARSFQVGDDDWKNLTPAQMIDKR